MLYFIIKGTERAYIEKLDYTGNTDQLQNFLKACGVDVRGMFGREDYATLWRDFYNKEITRKELRERLGL